MTVDERFTRVMRVRGAGGRRDDRLARIAAHPRRPDWQAGLAPMPHGGC